MNGKLFGQIVLLILIFVLLTTVVKCLHMNICPCKAKMMKCHKMMQSK